MSGPALARQPNPLPNPFRPGNGVPPPYLAGRDRLLAAFEDWLLEAPPLHANWALVGLRGTGKTVLLGEFAARAERAGWLTLHRELGDRHRDDRRLAEAIVEDCDALMGRADAMAAVGRAGCDPGASASARSASSRATRRSLQHRRTTCAGHWPNSTPS
jgi:hypothetical protein